MKPPRLRVVGTATCLLGCALTTFGTAKDLVVDPRSPERSPTEHLLRAVEEARGLPPGEPRRIIVRPGIYENVALRLDERDSGLEIVAAPGARPRLLGGQRLTNWVRGDAGWWSARLTEFPVPGEGGSGPEAPNEWQVRSLLVNGELAPRARYPAEGRLEHLSGFDVPWMSTTGGGWKRKPTQEELTSLRYRPGDLGAWLEPGTAEITVFHMWDESCVGIADHDPATQTLRLSPPCGHPPGAFGVKQYVLWNLPRGMTQPGQWYHDPTQARIVYWPPAGMDPNDMEIVVPTVNTILRLAGRPEAPVRNVALRGLEFSVSTVPLLAGGFAANAYPGALSIDYARNCRLADLVIRGVAGQGIRAGRSLSGIVVQGCEVSQCGAGGIYVGGEGSVIEDNHVHGIGRQYPSAIGIYRGGRNCTVRHNEIHDCTYSAINYGGTGNVIENNLIYDCMKVLHDGAAIYMFAATNCILRGNFARDIADTGGYGASAYYLDERSSLCVVERNVSLRVRWPSHHHMATNNIVRNNLFFVEGDAKLTFPRSTLTTMERNLIYATGKIRIENVDAVARWDRNLLFSQTGLIEQVRLDRYATREVRKGAPPETVTADPELGDWRKGDFTWAGTSPVHRLGIQPVDVSQAGRRTTR